MNVITFLKSHIHSNSILANIARYLYGMVVRYKSLHDTLLNTPPHYGSIIKDIRGNNNSISLEQGSHCDKIRIRIRGNNNTLSIGANCKFGKNCSIWMEGNDIKIIIGDTCTFTTLCHINAQEDGASILIGDDCMLSNNIIIRTSDSHPIYDIKTNERLNRPQPIEIGNHVWIAPNTKIMKGASIANGCIIGSDTTVSKKFIEPNCLIVGRPAKIVRSNVRWSREHLF